MQPAAEGYAVGDIDDPAGKHAVQVTKHRHPHQVGMQRRDAVDPVRAEERQVAHAHAPALVLIDDRHRRQQPVIVGKFAPHGAEMQRVDQVDDLHVARQQPFHQWNRPDLQRLGQQRVVGVTERGPDDLPGFLPRHLVHIQQNAHQFRDGDRRMRVIQLDRRLLGQGGDMAEGADMPAHEVLQRGRDEEILLPQPQFLAGRRRIGRIQHLGNRRRAHLIRQRIDMVAAVERVEPQRIGGVRRPQSQRVHPPSAPTDRGRVIGDRLNRFGRMPDVANRGFRDRHDLDRAAEADVIADFRPVKFPRVAQRQPVFRIFLLPAVLHDLAEQAVVVADAVAVGGDVERRHALHEAGCEPAQAAIAQRGIGFQRTQLVEIDVEAG